MSSFHSLLDDLAPPDEAARSQFVSTRNWFTGWIFQCAEDGHGGCKLLVRAGYPPEYDMLELAWVNFVTGVYSFSFHWFLFIFPALFYSHTNRISPCF